jgi:hypothetical protein
MATSVVAQTVSLAGKVIDENAKPIEFASILLVESGQWAISDENGHFAINNINIGKLTLTVQCLGYQKRTLLPMTVDHSITNMVVRMKQESLKLDEVTVTAKRKTDEATTSYTIDRAALDQQQLLNVADIATLLPGGKTVNPTLMSDSRMALRSSSQEKGNASFGTAIEVDGMRLDNNAAVGETTGASTRTIGASNIESIEVVTGIPSVEYGDLSNGVVKVNTRRGKSPFIVEGSINQHTHQIAVNKGFDLGSRKGVLNVSLEHANSFSNAASPYTAYQRNILSLHYMNVFWRQTTPLTVNVGFSGNIGGYNSEADPDQELDDYSKVRDNALRANADLHLLLNKRWLTNLQLKASLSYADRKTTNYTHASSATTLAYLHGMEDGYFMAQPYTGGADVPAVVLGPTGYWHVMQYGDSKPLSWSVRLKGEQHASVNLGSFSVNSRLKVGADYTGSRNNGRGTYYDDMRYAPTWRPYSYDELPTLHNMAFYAEEKLMLPVSKLSTLELTVGLRDDITYVSNSEYGTVNSLSPRVNARLVAWRNRKKRVVSDLLVHAGWGKSVKLPSFQVLYPAPSYYDVEVFKAPSTADNTTVSAHYIHPQKAVFNPELRWQYTLQTDIGVEMTVKGTHLSLSAFHHRTYNPYMSTTVFTPFSYLYTAPSALDAVNAPSAERTYSIDRSSGLVTVTAAGGSQQQLAGSQRRVWQANNRYVNASPPDRYGLEWTVDFQQINALNSRLRIDGSYYYYKGIDDVLFADIPASNATMSDGQPYQYVGYYRGSSATTAGYAANASVTNGAVQRALNLNGTITTHIPKIRLIVALRVESTLYSYRRSLSEYDGGTRGIVLADKAGFTGTPYDGTSENCYIALYPEYYSTWANPDERIPFEEKFLWAKDNDAELYNDLSKLVVRSNYPYTMNPSKLSAYWSANLSVTKEIGDHVSVSFYANNFLNNMSTVHNSQTDLRTSLFGSSYIPSYYYGLSLRLKL